jgi:hypothetical protein
MFGATAISSKVRVGVATSRRNALQLAKIAAHLIRRGLPRGFRGRAFAFSKLLTYALTFVGGVTALALLGLPVSTLVLTSSATSTRSMRR